MDEILINCRISIPSNGEQAISHSDKKIYGSNKYTLNLAKDLSANKSQREKKAEAFIRGPFIADTSEDDRFNVLYLLRKTFISS